jgi:hypothetical protein
MAIQIRNIQDCREADRGPTHDVHLLGVYSLFGGYTPFGRALKERKWTLQVCFVPDGSFRL